MAEVKVVEGKDMTEEHIAGGTDSFLSNFKRTLPQYVDDITRDYGQDTYERMLTDPAVDSSFSILKDAVLADDIQLVCAVEAPEDEDGAEPGELADHEESETYRAFVQRALDGAETPILDVAAEMLDGLAFGHKVAEVVLKPGAGEDSGRLTLRAVKPRPRQNLAFVVDEFYNTLGVAGVMPGEAGAGGPVIASALGEDLGNLPNFVPIDQLLVFRWRPRNGDPRGASILRSAYNPWYMKTKIYPDYFKYLKQFASPSVIGKTAQNGQFQPVIDDQGNVVMEGARPKVKDASVALLASLIQFLNSTALVVPHGTEIETLFSQGEGKAFLAAHDFFDRQISMAILKTTRLNQEAEHGSRADSGTAQDVTGTRIQLIRKALQSCLNHLSKLLIRVNFGDDAVRLAPKFSLAGQEAQDWAKELDSVAKAFGSGFIHESQLPLLDQRLGLPARDMEAIALEKAENAHHAALRAGDLSKVMNPAEGAEDGE